MLLFIVIDIIIIIVESVAGVMISSGGEPSFHIMGVIICLLSTALRAMKSVVQGYLMSNNKVKQINNFKKKYYRTFEDFNEFITENVIDR